MSHYRETEVLYLEATLNETRDVYKLIHISYFDLACDIVLSGTNALPFKTKTLCLSEMVLHTYQTAECHKPEDINLNGHRHKR
jgi:hypothetical protein